MTANAVAVALLATITSSAAAIDLQGHRGTRGLAPENTLAAFRTALAIGVTTLETDLALTRDGVLVLSHEPRLYAALTRGADGRWLSEDGPLIFSLKASDLAQYDVGRMNPAHKYAAAWTEQKAADGERIPTLQQLFDLARDARSPGGQPVRFNIETKITPTSGDTTPDAALYARAVVDEVRAARMSERVTVQSFDWRTLREVKKIAPDLQTACLTIDSSGMNTVSPDASGGSPWHAGLKVADYGGSLPRMVQAAGCSAWAPFWRNVTPENIAETHALNLKIIPWTINDAADIERLAALGVDGIITDYPDRAQRALAARVSID
ncbi:MAG TPA: glycerophosphodiester phosphodiesterase [Burkholderiaceae bacterium]|nr:glycerophosphodiester phosphodiesterase [Burkholderiaceae bacterium]